MKIRRMETANRDVPTARVMVKSRRGHRKSLLSGENRDRKKTLRKKNKKGEREARTEKRRKGMRSRCYGLNKSRTENRRSRRAARKGREHQNGTNSSEWHLLNVP